MSDQKPLTAGQIVRDICNRRRNLDIRADDKELGAAIDNAISSERVAYEKERAAHAETRERCTQLREALKYKQRGMTFTESERNVELVRQLAETRELSDKRTDALAEALGCLSVIASGKHDDKVLKDLAAIGVQEIHKLAVGENITPRNQIEQQLAETLGIARELAEAGQNMAYYTARIAPPPYGHPCRWCGDCVQRTKDELRAALNRAAGILNADPLPLRPAKSAAEDAAGLQGGRE